MCKYIFYYIFFLANVFSFFNCNQTKELKRVDNGINNEIDKFWDSMVKAIREKKIDYLVENSKFEIECKNCGINQGGNELYESRIFFTNYIDKINPPEKKNYTLSTNVGNVLPGEYEKLHLINYSLKKDRMNIIYSIEENSGVLKFRGSFTVP